MIATMKTRGDTAEIGLLGAGIIGLTAGLRLLAQGWRVVIYAREITPHTTSDIAAALWFPYKVAPKARVKKWAENTRMIYGAMEQRGVPGVSTAQNDAWNLEPDQQLAAQIVLRCAALRPELAGARILGHLVGLRPGRPTVRLELEPRPGGRAIIHDYGHGGAGFTLAWACADEVVDLAREWSASN